MYRTAEPVMKWAKANESYLHGREPVASIGLVWSQRNTDFYGRDEAADRVDAPYTGFLHALVRARLPYLPVHVDDLASQAARFSVLILPDLGALGAAHCDSVRRFVERGGSLVATGVTSLYDEWGDPRPDYQLADVFGCRRLEAAPRLAGTRQPSRREDRFAPEGHSYLRLHPELRARLDGPKAGDEPVAAGERHEVLLGFEETDIVPFGGLLSPLEAAAGAIVPLTYVPPFPTYPPETSWMREPKTSVPGLVLTRRGGSRVAFLPADIDRRYALQHLTDHGDLLANIVRWAAGDSVPVSVVGPGWIDCHLYRQGDRLLLHLVNLTSAATWRAPLEEYIPVGPLRIRVRVDSGRVASWARLLVAGGQEPVSVREGRAEFRIASVTDHELVVLD